MRQFYLLTLLLALYACKGSKTVYDDKNITEKKLEKLMADYAANPRDSQKAGEVRYAYEHLLAQKKAAVNQFTYGSTLRDKERYYESIRDLQLFYNNVKRWPSTARMVNPEDIGRETEEAKLAVASAYYTQAETWTQDNNWRTSRQAYRYFQKVQSWMPDYRDTRTLIRQAKDQSVIDAAISQLRAEGFYYNDNSFGSGFNRQQSLSDQLARDLSSRYSSNGDNLYRVYTDYNRNSNRNNEQMDWSIEPVWTQLQFNQPRTQTREEKRSKNTEIGKDSLGRPIYKTLTATLTIYEQSTEAEGAIELRIYDVANNEAISNNRFRETYRITNRWASYKGDAGALNNEDWEMLNASRNPNRLDNRLLEERLLEKMYPDLLNHLRNRLSNYSF